MRWFSFCNMARTNHAIICQVLGFIDDYMLWHICVYISPLCYYTDLGIILNLSLLLFMVIVYYDDPKAESLDNNSGSSLAV